MEWIDVRQELPPRNTPVLIWSIPSLGATYAYAEMCDGVYFDTAQECLDNCVTHWALVSPPKEQP